ncbi:MAG: hypothetical protein LBD59_05405 [Prevotellaceae bacterium]|jgi:hypothetical protein|nr:hypothetical protein [Prevotellaceae bacterium]
MRTGIITECYADTLMLKIATRDNPNLQHQRGCNKVSKTMQEKFADTLAIGVIDYDKKLPPYLSEFAEIENFGALKLYKHPAKLHYFITISPAIEKFLIETAKQSKINLADYNLPADLNGLKTITKSATSNNNVDLARFFRVLVSKNAENFTKIAEWIAEIEKVILR